MPDPTPRAPRPLGAFDVEGVRFSGERVAAATLGADPGVRALLATLEGMEQAEPARVRRQLMARSLRLTEGMAGEAYAAAREAAEVLGIDRPLEIYQSAGAENAVIHLVEEPVLLEIRGRLLSLLDRPGTVAVFGHELGHHLAHGPRAPEPLLGVAAAHLVERPGVPADTVMSASSYLMACEITADRFGLLACGDLAAALRLEMAATTGLPADELTWDTDAYLEQCRVLVQETLDGGETARGITHPEHGLRAWALWLFSESDRYRELTGRGPGTRPIADVDAEIARLLVRRPGDDVLDSVRMPAPPPEVHECALASAVLIALADGELHDDEAAVIERLFASLVPDWQRYLSWDEALAAFAEAAPVVIAGGASAQRAVFHLLVHVLGADGTAREPEVEMVCAVGDALRCGTMYRSMLTAVLRTLGVDVALPGRVERVIPMPARSGEAEAALRAFLGGVLRRRGGRVTLRRLLRLLGDRDARPETVASVWSRIDELGLVVGVERDGIDLDAPFDLTLSEAVAARLDTPAPPAPDPDPDPARQRLGRALSRLRDALVSGDGRSPSIRLRRCRTGRALDFAALDDLSVGHAERVFAHLTAGQPARLVDASEVGVHDGARRIAGELVALHREAVSRFEETGAHDLFVGAPFLTGVVDGYLVRGPLVLHPYDLERSSGGARGFRLVRRDGDAPVCNQALIRLLFTKLGFEFPDDLPDALDAAAAAGAHALVERLGGLGVPVVPEGDALTGFGDRDEEFAGWPDRRLVTEPVAVLGFFPQSTSDMIQDYDGLLAAVGDPSVDVASRLGAAAALLPADLRAAVDVETRVDAPTDPLVPVVAADPSQRHVLRRAREERALVVDGPPGTGKSQVIVNLVVDALSRGETVAVVCEKRAAIDVVAQRLEAAGLRHLLALVHDVHDDRRPLFDQVASRLEEPDPRDHDADALADVEREIADIEAELSVRREALVRTLDGQKTPLAMLHALAASLTAPPLPDAHALVRLDRRTLLRFAERVGRQAQQADLHREGSPWRAPDGAPARPSLADATPDDLARIEGALRRALQTAGDLARHVGEQDPADLLAARPGLEAARAARSMLDDADGRRVFAAWLRLGEDPAAVSALSRARRAWAEADRWLPVVSSRVRFEASPELEVALATIQRVGGRFWRFLSLAWWRARGVVRGALAVHWPERAAAPVTPALAGDVRDRSAGSEAWAAFDALHDALGLPAPEVDSAGARARVERFAALFDAARPVLDARSALAAVQAWSEPGSPAWDDGIDARLDAAMAAAAHRAAAAPVVAVFPWLDAIPSGEVLSGVLDAWTLDAARVAASDRAVAVAAETHPDARRVVEALAALLPDARPDEWRDAVLHGWALASIAQVERRHPDTRSLDRPTAFGELEEAADRLAEAVRERGALHVRKVLAERDRVPLLREARPEKGRRRTPLQKAREQMLREASKKRYMLSLRGFTRQFADQGLMDVLPVWLLSPETMAVLFPGRPVFDLVIMDEASQATVEKGLPALVRGRRAVVAGDEKQMPPTSFFQAGPGDDDEPPAAFDEDATDALQAESLLVLARERVAHEGLLWHYRCLHEELIAFSNHAMYGGELFTIPSTVTPAAPPALRWVSVEDGAYHKGANPVEAERVVDLLAELLEREDPPSVGVVTFNTQQRRVVLDAIDARREASEAFQARWDVAAAQAALDRRPFVKNLESVQGDERDVIVFSLGHAPVPRRRGGRAGELYVPARFGPLGRRGGERRLNVAVSRARRECFVVASFEPSMLSVGSTLHEGPKLFKAFLEFAWALTHGRRLQAARTLDRVRHGGSGASTGPALPDRDGVLPLSAQVALALDERGVAYELDVGSSGFRVPIAVVHPDHDDRYAVAVLCDQGDAPADLHEAHVHQPGVLAARGWRVVRVDARRWHRRPDDVLRELLDAVEACRASTPVSEPAPRSAPVPADA